MTEKAKEIAEKLGKPDFKGSCEWLDKWYNVKQLRIRGESGDVRGEIEGKAPRDSSRVQERRYVEYGRNWHILACFTRPWVWPEEYKL